MNMNIINIIILAYEIRRPKQLEKCIQNKNTKS